MRGDMHLGRSKAGEKPFLFRAGSDWCELEGVSDDPFTRTPALPKAGHIRWMARNPSMTAAKTAVPSIPTNRSSGASGGRCWERSKHPAPIAASWRAGLNGAGSAGFGKHPDAQGASQGLTEEYMKEQAMPNSIFGYPSPSRKTPTQSDEALLYRVHTAQAKLGVSRSTIYRLVNEGELVLIKIGKRSSGITAASVHALIERNRALAS